MKRMMAALVCMVSLLADGAAFAVLPDEMLANPAQEARAVSLSKTLRCVVCQNQNIDDSAAPIARDMRLLLRERIAAGDTDQQAVSYLVQRYGNFVLLKPPFQADTWLLWGAPFAVLLIAALAVFVPLRNRRNVPQSVPLTDAERQRLTILLGAEAPIHHGSDK